MKHQTGNRNQRHLIFIAKVAILSALSMLVMLLEIPLPIFPSFYKLDLSEVVVLTGSFALGPWAGVVIELFKNLLKLLIKPTSTVFVGEIANFLTGCAFVVPAALLYRARKTKKQAMIGLGVGTLCLALVGAVINYFVLIPAYVNLYHLPLESIVEMAGKANGLITSLPSLIAFGTVPFNILKGFLCSLLTVLLYKRLSPILHK